MNTPKSIGKAALLLSLFLFAGLIGTPLQADTTVKAVSEVTGHGQTGGENVSYIKGLRMRIDQSSNGGRHSTVIDAETGRMIVIDHAKKRAEVTDVKDIAKALSSASGSEIHAEMTPTGRTKELLGQQCQEYMVSVRFEFAPIPDQPLTMVIGGPAWIAKNSPGAKDYARFYEAASEKGLFFGDPKAAEAQPGPVKGFTELYRAMAEAGVAYLMDLKVSFEGSGPMATMMSRVGGASISNRVTGISTEPLSDDLFEIPADYKVKSR